MREMFNRFFARRAFNALIFWLDWNHDVINRQNDYNKTIEVLDILRRYMDPKG
jgi:hypothetical protein